MDSIDKLRRLVKSHEWVYDKHLNDSCAAIDAIEREVADMMPLPLDADGVPIRVGDVMDNATSGTYAFLPAKGVGFHECWREVLPIVSDGKGEYQVDTRLVRHHQAPTVEDVLREFAYGLGVPVADSYVAATAAKLRLAEGSE